MEMGSEECESLVKEAEDTSKHSLDIAAEIFEDAAKCYDKEGNRRKSGQFLTLAGDFLLELSKDNQAATCYGKAIVRYLMVDDLDLAQILIKKGAEYGFSSANHHYRIALDSLERRKIAQLEAEASQAEIFAEETMIEEDTLPEVELMPLEDEEPLITLEIEETLIDEDVQIKQQEFVIPQLEKEDPSKVGSFAVLAAISKTTRDQSRIEQHQIQTNAVVKDATGETRILEPTVTITPITTGKPHETLLSEPIEDNSVPPTLIEVKDLNRPDALDLEYTGRTEIVNEYAEEIKDIEIVNTIPFHWQVIDVKSDFELEAKRRTEEGLVFTWKKDKISPGRKVGVEYVLRKRVERSIILRKENHVSVINSYHSIQKDLQASLEFVNTTGKLLQDILVEDIIPPELVINEAVSSQGIKPVSLPTHDSTLFRWIFSKLAPGDSFSVTYSFRERPITRWYTEEIESKQGTVIVEKISQPLIDSRQPEYIWMYAIQNPTSDELHINDRIPMDYEIVLVDPTHWRPSISRNGTQIVLSWRLPSKISKLIIILRISGKESITPLAPVVRFSQLGEPQLVDREVQSQRRVVDIRKIR